MPKTRKQARSAKTGRFVKSWVAERYPDTTVVETIRNPRKKKQAS